VEYAVALLALAALVALVVAVPLRRPGAEEEREDALAAELEAAKEAKYREIRDAELDHRMGKLSDEDWRTVDRELRGEAIEILRRLDRVEGRPPAG
jgi:membrane protein implicated in regulation of membrane protease activity